MKRAMAKKKVQSKPQRIPWEFIGLGVLILLVYANSFTAGLLFDSTLIIQDDPRLREFNLANVQQIFINNYWWPSQDTPLYRPLTTLTYLFNYAVLGNGQNVGGYHVVNFLLHWLNACLVLVVVRRLAGRLDLAVLTACLFAVHPINTEAVTNIVGRADLLATLFVLSGGWCYLKSLEPGPRTRLWLGLLGISACLGVVAKENAVMIVGFIALYDFLWRRPVRAAPYIALVPSLVLIAVIRKWMSGRVPVFGEFFTDNPITAAAPFPAFMTAMNVTGRYLKLLVFPRTLSADYSFNEIPVYPANSGTAWLSLVVIVILLAAALWLHRRHSMFSWGVLFLFGMMAPTANVLVKIGSIMADRFMYLPSIGFCAVVALGLCAVAKRTRWVLPVIIVAALGARAYARNADWHDELSLWKSTVSASPASFKAHMGYGDALFNAQQPLDVIAEEETARSIIEPNPPIPLELQTNAVYLRLGRYYRLKGDSLDSAGGHDEAVSFYRKSIEALAKAQALDAVANKNWRDFRLSHGMAPKDVPDVGNFVVYQQLGLTYARLADWEKCESIGQYMQHIAPDQALGYQLVGNAYFNLHRYPEAAVQFVAAVMIDPGNRDSWANATNIYNAMGVEPNPVTQQGGTMVLNPQQPEGRRQVNEAATLVVRRFEEAKQVDRAGELKEQLIKEYSVPADIF